MTGIATLARAPLLAALLLIGMPAWSEQVVIVNANRAVDVISQDEVINIFMGRYRKLPDGTIVYPLDLRGDSDARRSFYRKLLDKDLAEINAYWARLVFSGRTTPPAILDSQQAVVNKVAGDAAVIGYVDSQYLNPRVKVVYRLPE